MKNDIIISGVGGQGILSIAAVIGMAAYNQNIHFKQAEVHGMSQRGGAVQSHLRLSTDPIASDLIPIGMADMVLAVEPMEALRYLPYLKESGWMISNTMPFKNIPDYPEEETIYKNIKSRKNNVLVDAENIAADLGNKRISNMVILGASSVFIDMDSNSFIDGIRVLFAKKGDDLVELNISAYEKGRACVKEYLDNNL